MTRRLQREPSDRKLYLYKKRIISCYDGIRHRIEQAIDEAYSHR